MKEVHKAPSLSDSSYCCRYFSVTLDIARLSIQNKKYKGDWSIPNCTLLINSALIFHFITS